jgi:NAD(P)-dependent dehydrogenase (short-subunit alcohol dehydrogenase family)
MAGRLQDRVALITGAGSIGPGWGNGKATAVLFAREGTKVFAVDLNLEAAEETGKLIRDEGGVCVTHRADVAQADSVQAMVDACIAALGRIDVLVNNVGIARTGSIVTTEEADWDLVADVNLKSVYLACRRVVPIMERQGKGAIVNIASVAAHRWTGISYASYYATKGAIISLSRSIALEWAAKGIRCNTVSPGLMNTPHGRLWRRRRRREPDPGARCTMPDRPYGRGLGHGACLPVPRLRRGQVRHRARSRGRRRPDREDGVTAAPRAHLVRPQPL